MEPNAPAARSIGPDDWKNRMSAPLLMFTKQILASSGLGSEQEPSTGRKRPVMYR